MVTCNDPMSMAERHGITNCGEVIGKIAKALAAFSLAAATMP
jgi:hypothetical protein